MDSFGFPELVDSYLAGQDLLFTQFNEIDFFVEDYEQENLYYEILKKIFTDIRFDKIFPLNGKTNVIAAARGELGNKRKIFIVDRDFDGLILPQEELENLFYLDRYSIENYLVEKEPFIHIIKQEKPALKEGHILEVIEWEELLLECQALFKDLIPYYLVIQEHNLGIKNADYGNEFFCDTTTNPAILKQDVVTNYKQKIEDKYFQNYQSNDISAEFDKHKSHFDTVDLALKNVPGKYILNFLRTKIEHKFSISKINLSSLSFRLSERCSCGDLTLVFDKVHSYLAN